MLQKIETFLSDMLSDAPPKSLDDEEVKIACAALLVHAAKADGHQSDRETAKLREILRERFALSSEDVETLIGVARKREADAVDVHRFTRVLHKNLDRAGRHDIIRLLWEVALADGHIDYDERSVVTLVASLMDVETPDVVALRRAVMNAKSDT